MDAAETQIALDLQGFTYAERPAILPELSRAIDNAGGWILERRPTSASTIELFVEVQTSALAEVYAALVASGLELTRDSHRALAERCNLSLYLQPRSYSSILSVRVEVHFLVDSHPPLDLKRLRLLGVSTA